MHELPIGCQDRHWEIITPLLRATAALQRVRASACVSTIQDLRLQGAQHDIAEALRLIEDMPATEPVREVSHA